MAKMRVLTHLSWCALALYAILVLLISIALIPLGIIMIEGCDTIEDLFSSPQNFHSYEAILSKDVSAKLEVCYFSDGDFNKIFDTSEAFQTINSLTESFNNNPNISILVGSKVAPIVLSTIKNYTSFDLPAYIIDPPSSSPYSSPLLALDDLNKWSDFSIDQSYQKSQGGCSISQDNFVFDVSKCKYQQIFISSGLPNQNFGQQTCIDVSSLQGKTTSRYTTSFAGCNKIINNEVGTMIETIYTNEVEQLAKHKSEVLNVFNQLKTDVESYQTDFNLYQQDLLELNDKVRIYMKNGINDLLSAVSDNKTGLIAGLNCSFAKVATNSFKSTTCFSFAPSILLLFIIFLISGGFALFSGLFLIIMALKIKRLDEYRQLEESRNNNYEYIPKEGSNKVKS
jgi:hypothetical protein